MKIFRPMVEFARRTLGVAKRSITSLPWSHGGPRHPYRVSTEQALSLIPYFACVRILAEQISSLPLQTFRREGDVRLRITDPQLVANPAAVVDPVTWMRQAVISLAVRGNAVGLVTGRDGMGFVTSLEWLSPDDVFVDDERPSLPRWYVFGVEVPAERIVHIAWFVQPGRVWGLSPIAAFAASIGIGLQATQFGSSWFEHGGTPPATFKNTRKTITRSESDEIGDRLAASMRRRRPLVFGTDWEFSALKVTPEESQFIQTMKLNATQMAAIFGVPAEMVGGDTGGSLTYNNPEMNGRALLKFTLRPWLVLLESGITRLLPERQYVQFNVDAVERADTTMRYQAHHLALTDGWMNRDEVRALEELPPLPNGQGQGFAPITGPPRTLPGDQDTQPRMDLNGHREKELTS